MRLITEQLFEPMSILSEADASGKKHIYIQGPFAISEVKNKNGRIYKRDLLESVISKYNDNYIKQNRSLGEINHPPRLSIDYERASHLVTEMVQDGNIWIGKAKILKTPIGKVLEGLVESGVSIGVSTRGAGSITESKGAKYVNPDFVMTAVDAVSDPSGQYIGQDGSMQSAFVNGILEGVEFAMTDKGFEIVSNTREEIVEAYNKKAIDETFKLQVFQRFMNAISKV